MEGLQKVVNWFLDANDNPNSHQNIIITLREMLAHRAEDNIGLVKQHKAKYRNYYFTWERIMF